MIVKDLISELKKLPQDATVVIFDSEGVEFVIGIELYTEQNQVVIDYSWTLDEKLRDR
jgi:hypothetical protein